MKFVIAVSSCKLDQTNANNTAIRKTWGKIANQHGVPYFLTVGGSEQATATQIGDEILTPCPDLYPDLGHKTIFNARHALFMGFDHMFQCFTDTYISIPRLIPAYHDVVVHSEAPMIGNYAWVTPDVEENHPCGGSGYWLNRAGMEVVANWSWDQDFYVKEARQAEDRLVSRLLRDKGMEWITDPRYDNESHAGGVSLNNKNISNHLSFAGHKYSPGWMIDEHKMELTGKPSRRAI